MNAVDTNVLIYAYDTREPARQRRAVELLSGLTDGVLLWQVACEFVAASRRLASHGLEPAQAWANLEDIRRLLPLVLPSAAVLETARGLHREGRVQFWDAMIYAACADAGVRRIYSEDLPGASVAGLEIVNPFA